MGIRAVLFMVALVGSLPVCFFRPFYGVLVWTVIAFTSLQWYAWAAYDIPCALLVAIATLAGFFIFTRGVTRLGSRETFLLAALWAWFVLTSIISTNTPLFVHHADATWRELSMVSKVLLMAIVTVGIVDSFPRLRILVMTIACCFGFFVTKSLPFLILSNAENRIYGPEKSMIADNNDFGLALNMTLPMFFFLAKTETTLWRKRLFGALFLMTIPAILFTYSRGALLGLVTILTLMFIQLKQRAILVPVVGLLCVVGLIFAPAKWKERMDPTREGALDKSALSRINSWTYSWNLAKDYPIAGGGFNTFTQELFDRYAPNAADLHGPHSIYFGILAEHGFVGLGLFLALIGSCFASVLKIMRWARYCGDETAASYANMFGLSLVGFLASGTFLGRQYFDYYFTVIACVVILKKICFETWRQSDFERHVADSERPEEELAEAV